MATRHLIRSVILQSLYEWDFFNHKKDIIEILERNLAEFAPGIDEPEFAWKILDGVLKNINKIDSIANQFLKEWSLEKTNLIDKNILRIGIYELLYANRDEVPYEVAIDQAMELAKAFGGPNSLKFINGVLGSVYDKIKTGEITP